MKIKHILKYKKLLKDIDVELIFVQVSILCSNS